jgi:hypothetical protein
MLTLSNQKHKILQNLPNKPNHKILQQKLPLHKILHNLNPPNPTPSIPPLKNKQNPIQKLQFPYPITLTSHNRLFKTL